ncbi:MAG: hypothetical protein PVG53_09055 [Holophagae bacterium]
MTTRNERPGLSKKTQLLLIALAAVVSFVPLVAEQRQGNSIRWSVDGDRLDCEYFQIPSFSHVRSYDWTKIDAISEASDSKRPEVTVVRLELSGLNLNIPSQSDELIWNFDGYLAGLQGFMARVRAGDASASYTWYHPWLITGVASTVAAVILWIVVFTVLLGPRQRQSDSSET